MGTQQQLVSHKGNGGAAVASLPSQRLLNALQKVRDGDFSVRLPGDLTGIEGKIADTFNDIVMANERMAAELKRVGLAVGKKGQTSQRVRFQPLGGEWGDMEGSINVWIDDLLWPTTEVTRAVSAVAQGDLLQTIPLEVNGRPLKGEFLRSANIVNTMIQQLVIFTSEVTSVAREVGVEGRLGGQANVPGASGTWKDLTGNVNLLAANLTTQVRAIAEVATAVAKGDLTRSIQVDARGEVAELKDNINTMITNLRHTTERNSEQDWLKTNLARVTGLLQGQRDLGTVGKLLLSDLTPLVSAQLGVIYLMDAEDRQHGLARGAFSFITKPATPDGLKVAFSRIKDFASPRQRRSLVVEDDAAEQLSIRAWLEHNDIEMQTVSSGEEALAALKERTFDCVVLDLRLPDISGFDVLEKLRKNDSPCVLPTVVFTGKELTPDEDARLHSIARSIVVKGVESPERLLEETALFLHRVVASAWMAQRAGLKRAISFDMGGTSTDVCLLAGPPRTTNETSLVGLPVAVPVLDVHSVGAGGGSLARIDAGGALRVGPESAGASPGPVCYGRGGAGLTVTDANLILGRLDPEHFLGGTFKLDAEAARRAFEKFLAGPARHAGFASAPELAAGIVAASNATMEKALRVISVERGYDPARFFADLLWRSRRAARGRSGARAGNVGGDCSAESRGIFGAGNFAVRRGARRVAISAATAACGPEIKPAHPAEPARWPLPAPSSPGACRASRRGIRCGPRPRLSPSGRPLSGPVVRTLRSVHSRLRRKLSSRACQGVRLLLPRAVFGSGQPAPSHGDLHAQIPRAKAETWSSPTGAAGID